MINGIDVSGFSNDVKASTPKSECDSLRISVKLSVLRVK